MYRPTFDIVTPSTTADDLGNSLLLMEVGERVFSYVLYHKNKQRFLGFRQYSLNFLPDKSTLETLQDILTSDELLQKQFRETYVIYNYADSNLLPEKNFHIELNKPVTELVYGNARKGLLLSEKVYGWSLYNIYRIPREVHTIMQQKFAAGKYWHYNTLLLSGLCNDESDPFKIRMVVAADQFTVAVFKKDALQLLQTYLYQTPDDVSWHLLAICNRFQVQQEDVLLSVAGLIDEQSNLYQELLKYFLQVQWEALPDSITLDSEFSQFPAHYFSPLLKMALCV